MKKIKLRSKKPKPVVLDQWIEIKRKDDQTITEFYPSNLELENLRLEMDPQPSIIYRRFNFFHGIPAEYRWATPKINSRFYGGQFIQRVPPADWPGLMEQELLLDNKLAISSPRCYARPEAYGPCPCHACTRERDLGLPSRLLPCP